MSENERPGAAMTVRCHRCEGEAAVTAPFSQAPQIHYPDALAAQCQEARERRATGAPEFRLEDCQTLRRALTAALGGRDD